MASIITKLTGIELVALCASGDSRMSGTGVSAAPAGRPAACVMREAVRRPLVASAAAVVEARGDTYAKATRVVGAGNQIFGQQKTQLHTMWALRGLNPWSDPA